MSFYQRVRIWADTNLGAGPPMYVGIGAGLALDSVLLLLHTTLVLRIVVLLLVAIVGRFTTFFGNGSKLEGWHMETLGGAFITEWLAFVFICHRICQ